MNFKLKEINCCTPTPLSATQFSTIFSVEVSVVAHAAVVVGADAVVLIVTVPDISLSASVKFVVIPGGNDNCNELVTVAASVFNRICPDTLTMESFRLYIAV
jgi:hypothetical protein